MRRAAVKAGIQGIGILCVLSGCTAIPGAAPGVKTREKANSVAQRSLQCQELSRRAQAAIDKHDDESAVNLLRQLVAMEPKSAEAHHRLGRELQILGRLPEAEIAYRHALLLDREYIGAMIGLGTIESLRGQKQEAIRLLDSAIELDPHQADAHLERAKALEALGRSKDAMAAYFRTLEFAPNSVLARLRIATLQIARNQPDQALARLDPLVDQNPTDPEIRHQRGRAHLALNHQALAISDLSFAATNLPNQPEVHFHLAQALAAANKRNDALLAADHALRLAPDYPEALALSSRLRR